MYVLHRFYVSVYIRFIVDVCVLMCLETLFIYIYGCMYCIDSFVFMCMYFIDELVFSEYILQRCIYSYVCMC